MKSPPKNRFSRALRIARAARKVSQEGFSDISGRTYVSQLERGERQATLTKIDELASVLSVHPGSLLLLSYLPDRATPEMVDRLLALIRRETLDLLVPGAAS